MEWYPVLYNGLETNVEVTRCGNVRKVKVDWLLRNATKNFKIYKNSYGYFVIDIRIKKIGKKNLSIHQIVAITFLNHKTNGHKLVIDHIDSDKLNNHIDNLRIVTHRENTSKERTIKSGLPVGVTWHKATKKYRSRIRINGIETYLGLFNNIEDASNAYQKKLKSLN